MALGASWKVALGVFAVLLFCSSLFMGLVVVPTANKARRIAGGYRTQAEAQAALQKNPNDAFAHITLAHTAAGKGDKVTALKEWQEAARLDPQNGYTQWSLPVSLIVNHRRDEAKKVLSDLAQSDHEEAANAAKWLRKMK